ncbi:hypothetical protein HanRHA438_Chr11g0520561 [Helianthus annuus]|nr:hypothetical protein HanRHA438_Chr11g0520561 [Helianthus annuus]KAJ0876526.1 hypothetical protein HanPSC8_Chr11g0489481 [Helianthus annuus]
MHIHIKLNEVICCWNQIKWSHTFLRLLGMVPEKSTSPEQDRRGGVGGRRRRGGGPHLWSVSNG